MKYLVFFLLLGGALQAQVAMSSYSQHQWNQLIAMADKPDERKSVVCASLPINELNGVQYVSVLGKVHSTPNWTRFQSLGVLRGAMVGTICTLKIPVDAVDEIELSDVFSLVEIPSKV
jgi:hypothetical protein